MLQFIHFGFHILQYFRFLLGVTSEIISSICPKFSTPVTIESKAFSKLDATLGLIFSKLSLFCLNPNIKNVGHILSWS
ncbi:unnamed protein product [Lactuca virosa]|uniref:Uncharacterized protein n=1 Tax=Lactuca virosa TaxID=75947 RepID=A0AAU9MEP0_9ASTR|nr:unnamed protein product [Lactuca virosa]